MADNVLDIFRSDAFGVVSMVSRMDTVQFVPTQARDLGIWTVQGINTRTAVVELRDQLLETVMPSDRGAPGAEIQDQARKVVSVDVPHFQTHSQVHADEVQFVREFGTPNVLQSAEAVTMRKLSIGNTNLTGTEEVLAVSGLQGVIKNAQGGTILDTYALFNVTKETSFVFPVSTSNSAGPTGDGTILAKFRQLIRKTWDNLRLGAVLPDVGCLASPSWFDAITTSNEMRTNYQRYQDNSAGVVGAFLREGPGWKKPPWMATPDCLVWEYRGPGIADGHAAFFPILPVGYPPIYNWYYAPADYMDSLGEIGRPRYARVAIDPMHQKFVDIEMQMNSMPLPLRPTALLDGSFS